VRRSRLISVGGPRRTPWHPVGMQRRVIISLALGKCDNLADPAARAQCQNQASADLNDARQTCQEQNDARLAACARLGGAPYDPVIDPSNFVTRIDNPYFPLTPGTTFIYEGHTAQGL